LCEYPACAGESVRERAAHADPLSPLAREDADGAGAQSQASFAVTTCRPRYVPQCAHARWRSVRSPHCGQLIAGGAESASWARRLSRLVEDVRRFGRPILPSSSVRDLDSRERREPAPAGARFDVTRTRPDVAIGTTLRAKPAAFVGAERNGRQVE